jgi:serine protease AprX
MSVRLETLEMKECRRRFQLCLWVLVLVCVRVQPGAQVPGSPVPPSAPAGAAANADKLDPLLQEAVLNPAGRSNVIIRASSAAAMGEVTALVVGNGGTVGRRLPILDAQVANVSNAVLLPLTASTAVARIAQDRAIAGTLERTGASIGAVQTRHEFGYDGSGVTVAVIDSGITPWHDDLTDLTAGQRVDHFVDFVGSQVSPYDDNGHGTHVAGIVAGNGVDSGGRRAGIAPAARLVVLKVLDAAGGGHISNVIAAFDHLLTHQDELDVDVVNLSVGAAVYESYRTDLLTLAAKRVVDAGITVVAAAGNSGWFDGRAQYRSVTAPGNAPWVLTIGASSHAGTVDRADDDVARFSSRGPTMFDRAAKPDLVAPGVGIESLSDPQSSLYERRSAYLLEGTIPTSYFPYLSLSGTSQSAPVVSGTIALMLQVAPQLTPNGIKAILQYTAETYPGYDAMTQGAGFLNARGAIALARFFASPASSYPASSAWNRAIRWGGYQVAGGLLMPDANAWSRELEWGATATATGDNIVWGTVWSDLPDLEPAWLPWSMHCVASECQPVPLGAGTVDAFACGAWCTPNSGTPGDVSGETESDTVVWGTTEEDTVVWGTTDDDTVVWGTTSEESTRWQ